MRSSFFLGALVPLAFACDNPETDACASALTVSSAAAATFCATYTQSSQTATTGLPAYATYCANKPKKLSSACSCLQAATTMQTVTASAVSLLPLLNIFLVLISY